MKLIRIVCWIHIKDKKILKVRSRDYRSFYIPGGKINKGESLDEALIREIKEELSVNLIPETIEGYGVFEGDAINQPEPTRVVACVFTGDYKGELKPSSEVKEMAFFTREEFMKTEDIPPIGRMITDSLHKDNFID